MKIKGVELRSSYLLAATLAVVALVWVLSGVIGGASNPADAPRESAVEAAPERALTRVRVRRQTTEMHRQELILRGQSAASRSVELKAETSSRIATIGAEEGRRVVAGQVIVELAREERDARLAQARALLRQRQVEYDAASKLSKKGFRADTKLAESEALLDVARAELKAVEVDAGNTTVVAPFDGVLESRYVEVGDFLDIGDKVARIIDLDPIYIVVNAAERDVGRLSRGDPATARLLSGDTVEGRVHYISAAADPETRTFRVEVEVPNPDHRLADGVSAEVRLIVDTVRAHRVSPAVLTLDDLGQVGVKTVNTEGIVEFHQVGIVSDGADGIWLDGLPETIDVITVGQEFVRPGQTVEPVHAAAAE
jgi:multidrug efflux system membrane fusion protein